MMGWGIPEQGWTRGPWTHEEDELLSQYVKLHGEGRWSSVARCTGIYTAIYSPIKVVRIRQRERELSSK
jgi:hypothetical protein